MTVANDGALSTLSIQHSAAFVISKEASRAMNFKWRAIVTVVAMALAVTGIVSAGTKTNEFHATTTYKSKCAGCHGAKAEKKFDPSKSDNELVQIILKGKKAEKPPNMPGYEAKHITAEQAKMLLDHMKSLRQ